MGLTILGEVKRITFENEESGFRVIRLGSVSGIDDRQELVIVGVMPPVGLGNRVRVTGKMENDSRHGERLKVESLVTVAPDTILGLEKYLGSGVIRGIGPGFAKRIVKYFGLETLRILDAEPHRMGEVPGLGKARVEELRRAWIEHTAMSNVLLALQSHGASPSLASKIIAHFGEKSSEIVQQSPYRLAIEMPGVGFQTADRIARSQGLSPEHPERAQAGILHELRGISDSGHCHCDEGLLTDRSCQMLGIAPEPVRDALKSLHKEERLVIEEERVYLKSLYDAELRIAIRVAELVSAPAKRINDWQERVREFEEAKELQLADAQHRAIEAAATQKFLVITGGPGVGKTTLVNAILAIFAPEKMRIHLAAPTGRAAKRMTESTGKQAQTLHRLLEVEGRGNKFARHADNPLSCDLLIIDEASMIDVHLADSLLQAIPNAARVVVVGDADQLPSVGPGAFLLDLIFSEEIPVARLDVIFRQAGESGIVQNSHKILRGEEPSSSDSADGDFFIIQCSSPDRAQILIEQMVRERIPSRFGLDGARDVQVLTPMHRGAAGTIALNERLQESLNPTGRALNQGDGQLRVGDKVLQTKNDYDRKVFNGDLGEVAQIDQEIPELTVRFETEQGSRLVIYEKSEIAGLSLAYATSIHKSQGSEYPAVVIPLLSSHFVMLSRNLLYTAVTRAKKLCVLVTDKKALSIALGETRREQRQTSLAERIKKQINTPAAN